MNRSCLVAVALLLGAACGGGSTNATQEKAASFATPNPLTVQVSQDTSRTASAIIGPSGGQVIASASTGATMTLTVPGGALLSPHTITLTPLASVTGFPLKGGVLAGVQLGPDGLLLAKAATLNIKLAASPSGGMKAYGFGYRHGGAEMHLMKASGGGTSLSLSIWHFSGAGVGAGSSSDATSQGANHAPSTPQDQVEQRLALGQDVVPLLLGWDAVLAGQLGQSPPNLPLLDTIYQQAFVFDALATQAGRPDLARGLYDKIALVLKTAAQLALTNCRSKPDAIEGLRVIRWLEWAQAHTLVLKQLDSPALEGEVVKCLRFKLDFMTREEFTFEPEAINLSVESKGIAINAISALPLKFAPATGDLKYDSYVWTVPAVRYTMSLTVDRPFSVQDVSMNLDVLDAGNASAVIDGMTLTVNFGDTTETAHVIAPVPVPPLPFKSFYANGMENMHHGTAVGPHLYAIRGWIAGAEPQFATLHETCPCEQVPAAVGYLTESQDTSWVLLHTPS